MGAGASTAHSRCQSEVSPDLFIRKSERHQQVCAFVTDNFWGVDDSVFLNDMVFNAVETVRWSEGTPERLMGNVTGLRLKPRQIRSSQLELTVAVSCACSAITEAVENVHRTMTNTKETHKI
jgi:hypothetical protein